MNNPIRGSLNVPLPPICRWRWGSSPPPVIAALEAGEVDLTYPAVTVALLKLNAVVGVSGTVNPAGPTPCSSLQEYRVASSRKVTSRGAEPSSGTVSRQLAG
jgi:hypothetical protein